MKKKNKLLFNYDSDCDTYEVYSTENGDTIGRIFYDERYWFTLNFGWEVDLDDVVIIGDFMKSLTAIKEMEVAVREKFS